eukprot:COSAG04_NODE_3569_length_2700_cov_2.414072_2_plen_766_part_01
MRRYTDPAGKIDAGAGCVTAEESSLTLTSSALNNCKGAGPNAHRALYLDQSTSVLIKDTTITPYAQPTDAVNRPLDDKVLDLATKGCETSPCESGHACSFADFSLWCAPCAEDNQYSADGLACRQCAPGKQPNADKSDCVECDGDDEYSVAGKCLQCGSGTQPAWEPGKHTGATACAGVYRCPRGHECPKEKCLNSNDCRACQTGKTSSDGGECKDCLFPQVHNLENSDCHPCRAGQGPNQPHNTECTNCTGSDASRYGVCEACSSGKKPDAAHVNCDAPYLCLAGDYCPWPTGCNHDAAGKAGACANCPPGRWNDDGGDVHSDPNEACKACDTNSEAVAADRRSCATCRDGKEPSRDHSSCIDCTGTNYSDNGSPCQVCQSPQVVGSQQDPDDRLPRSGHTKCEKCQAGYGPADCKEVDGVSTCSGGCAPCSGNTRTAVDGAHAGTCSDCPVGKIATEDHHDCTNCPLHQTYVEGISNVTGNCSCGTSGGKRSLGFYNVSEWGLIVCFVDGYQESDISCIEGTAGCGATPGVYQEWLDTDVLLRECQECPPCANCTLDSGPVLRDGYRAETAMAAGPGGDPLPFHSELMNLGPSLGHGQRFSYAFFCDEENAISPTAAQQFGYATTAVANERCPSRALTKAVVHSPCPEGHEGLFCESCQPHWYRAKNLKNQNCVECTDTYTRYGISGLGSVAALCLVIAGVRCCRKRRKIAKHRKQQATEMQGSVSDSQDGDDADENGGGAKTSAMDVDLSKFEEDEYFEDKEE